MKRFFKLRSIFIAAALSGAIGLIFFLFYEAYFNTNFRTTNDKIFFTQEVDLRGLRELKASGGTSVRFSDLKRRLSYTKDPLFIIDGIDEFHGYIRGIPSTFFAYQKSNPHWKYYIRRWIYTGSVDIHPELVIPEAIEAQKHGFSYANLKVGSKFISSDETIDHLVNILENIPANAWVHFHCHYGKGRTSMMLVVYDIMKNAPLVSLKNIVKRQHLLGSEDLLNIDIWKGGSYTKRQLEDRKTFISQFYDFICQRKAGGIQEWSTWRHHQTTSTVSTTPLHPKP
ncbi:MAG: hypothetical protein JNJ47_02825 [Alphaproteobacteria bacterium]|nr:hypothetical protein [Alphaproteobacteria bacterium]